MAVIDFPQGAARFSRSEQQRSPAGEAAARPQSELVRALQTSIQNHFMQLIIGLETGINTLRQVASAFDHAGFDAARFDEAATEAEQLFRSAKAKAERF
ncbi:MAG: hypothetical protein HY852_22440 [Bradyrhizobium sp.]|uniref:hypothetical protein n=1 Tax=Bradyrhizobium sp. TaxID=376 RepID=UPI0025C232BC|nr:hypothetical protein [Bradyrhizobium sp.]MBI5264563.1 hypothetical protein [Bradyrhizobium sp.]